MASVFSDQGSVSGGSGYDPQLQWPGEAFHDSPADPDREEQKGPEMLRAVGVAKKEELYTLAREIAQVSRHNSYHPRAAAVKRVAGGIQTLPELADGGRGAVLALLRQLALQMASIDDGADEAKVTDSCETDVDFVLRLATVMRQPIPAGRDQVKWVASIRTALRRP